MPLHTRHAASTYRPCRCSLTIQLSSSAEACRSTPAHPCRALSLTPELCKAEVLLTVCIAVVLGSHGRVATAHQIAPWSRGSDLHPCRALSLTPELCEAEVLLTVCIAVVLGSHGRVATAHQIAPWSRGSDLLSPTPVGAAFWSTFFGRFGTLPERHGHRTETPTK